MFQEFFDILMGYLLGGGVFVKMVSGSVSSPSTLDSFDKMDQGNEQRDHQTFRRIFKETRVDC